jgi:hypothetical protein
MYEEGLEPNLRLLALHSQMDRSQQATYEGKLQSKTVNDRKIAQPGIKGRVC